MAFENVIYDRQCNPENLHSLRKASSTHSTFTFGLWNCHSAVNKTEFIQALANVSDIQVLALTETWIRPENTATPAVLSADNTFSHTLLGAEVAPVSSFLETGNSPSFLH